MEQPSIFGEQFATAFQVRRRRMLPVFLKVYIWIGFLILLGCLIALLFSIGSDLLKHHHYKRRDSGWLVVVELSVGLGLITIFFTAVAALWFEAKWAIRYNWALGAILLAIFLFVIGISFDDWTGTDLTELSLPLVVAIPYYVMLYKIQYRWEHIAISKKEALTATPMK
ncbi:hypothetical protein SIO70_00085 [Chitinophaga sancti]|uniref:hypothetical protein n=1 Tax=Chitinophaga sancti TaxID=1004 RepID=UPI002A7648E9|nr:hypothetical protein [Chitinophaga sancti]WPQ63260.1 hypothetical protein SIO70_00085 [Chitinophaga sancti]